jgi:hypothetical protein
MKHVQYMGPGDTINVAPFGPHRRGEVKEYPDDFAMHLLRTSRRQRFTIVHNTGDPASAAASIPATIEERPDNAEPGILIDFKEIDRVELEKHETKTMRVDVEKKPARKLRKKHGGKAEK